MDTTKTVRTLARHKDLTCTVQEAVDSIRRGGTTVTKRLADDMLPIMLEKEVRTDEYYNGKMTIRVVDHGILVEEFRTWREAVLQYAAECGL